MARRKAAPAGRILATGLSVSATLGIMAVLASEHPGAGATTAPATPSTTIVTHIVERTIEYDPASPPPAATGPGSGSAPGEGSGAATSPGVSGSSDGPAAGSGGAPAAGASAPAGGGTAAAPSPAPPPPPPTATPTTTPAPVTTVPKCSGSKCP